MHVHASAIDIVIVFAGVLILNAMVRTAGWHMSESPRPGVRAWGAAALYVS